MSLTAQQYEKIIHFLDAEMTLEEMNEFEKELAVNTEMRQQLNFEQSVRDSFALSETRISGTVKFIKVSNEQISGGVRRINFERWLVAGIAASVLSVVLVIGLFHNNTTSQPGIVYKNDTLPVNKNDQTELVIEKPNSNDDSVKLTNLYKQYFKKDDLPEAYPMLLAEALTGYENGDYSSIKKLNLSNIPETRGAADTINTKKNILEFGHYYKGIAYLQTGNATEAISHLQWIIKNTKDKEILIKTQWFLALSYFKNNDIQKAVEVLTIVAGKTQNSELGRKAQEVLTELKK